MARVFVGMGGNVGDVLATFAWALDELHLGVGSVRRVSSAFRTSAQVLDASVAPDYWNAVCEMQTRLAPTQLLHAFKQLERVAGRAERGIWQPRPLDLDLLLYDDVVLSTAELQVPHACLTQRPFVLHPLVELAPELGLPPDGKRLRECLADLTWPWEGILRRQVDWWRGTSDLSDRRSKIEGSGRPFQGAA